MNLAFTAPPPPGADGFTDTGISGGHGQAQERELQAWKPDNNDAFGDMSMDTVRTFACFGSTFAVTACDRLDNHAHAAVRLRSLPHQPHFGLACGGGGGGGGDWAGGPLI